MFKPMLASPVEDANKLIYPLLASPKLDGVRAIVRNGVVLSRSLKPIPNKHVQRLFSRLEHWDGELIIGPQNSPTVYRDTVSGVMRENDEPEVTFCAFDHVEIPMANFEARLMVLKRQFGEQPKNLPVALLPQYTAHAPAGLLDLEREHLELGYEGLILRSPQGMYKYGRSTAREGYLLKLKRFLDSEAEVLEVVEEMHNGNEATISELGRTKRSSHKENKTGKGRAGALRVRDINTNVEFFVGTGLTDSDKDWWWLKGRPGILIKYKYFPVGVKDAPRHPVYLGLRDKRDL